MMDGLLEWLQSTGGPLPYVVLGLASLIEYVFPPFPGDTITLFGVFLAATAGWTPWIVYLVLDAGAVAGGMAAYGFGRWLARGEELPRLLRGPRTQRALDKTVARFEKHGAIYLVLNRFVPALRAFFFIGAGLAKLPAWKVALYGGISASIWNALLFGVGWYVGDNFERLSDLSSTYSRVVLSLLGLAALAWAAGKLWSRYRAR